GRHDLRCRPVLLSPENADASLEVGAFVIETALSDLTYGFGVALEPHNLMWCILGVLVGNMVGVLPGMGPLATISILLPLTFGMKPVAAILMLAGIYYGGQYGGAICSILLNLPCHPPHAVTCLDGYPMTKQGKGGTALGITVISSFVGASWGITEMIFLAPALVSIALQFGPAEVCSLMLLGLLAGSTLARGSPLKGIAMTVLGLLLGLVGADLETGVPRLTFGVLELYDGVEIVALALGLFGIAEFMRSINQEIKIDLKYSNVRVRDMWPSGADLKKALLPMFRGTLIGSLCSLIPGTGPTIASFVSYATEKKISKNPGKFGRGAIEGVACPEAATHSSVQGDFIPTMSLGIPGDTTMALLLGALMIQGIVPGPQLISQHPDIFWGLIASFWVGNIALVILNVPLIGLWVKLLTVPYKYLYPSALFFVCIGVYGANNDMFQVGETMVIGVFGYILLLLGFHPAPVLLGFVLGPRFEENFRRAMLISRGDLGVFVERPISAVFVGLCCILILAQVFIYLRGVMRNRAGAKIAREPESVPTTPQSSPAE
ncbi:MAG TPA: tripartite tricarboxylate transporter permease, partial [Pseudolabrys sp.]|nr:tripartite tricarboxylate transporter permease [Pseudolabrys sp.]